jgi:hypothetical protein
MKYRPMRFDPDYRPFVTPGRIYVIPLAAEPSRYHVLIPSRLDKNLLDLLIQKKLVIHRFDSCPPEALAGITAQIARSCSRGPAHYSIRMNQILVAGTILVVLGIVNFTFPDPLPLADELLMVGGGAGIGYIGLRNRRKILPLLRDKTERALEALHELECTEDILLTRIQEAIRVKGAAGDERTLKSPVDPFELESRWLVEILDLQQLLDAGSVAIEHLASLLDVLMNAFPLNKFQTLERKLRTDPKDRRARRARDGLRARYGLSADAFTVYAEFHRLAREILKPDNR